MKRVVQLADVRLEKPKAKPPEVHGCLVTGCREPESACVIGVGCLCPAHHAIFQSLPKHRQTKFHFSLHLMEQAKMAEAERRANIPEHGGWIDKIPKVPEAK